MKVYLAAVTAAVLAASFIVSACIMRVSSLHLFS